MRRGHSFDTVITLALFGLFAVCLLVVLMLGAKSYKSVVTSMQESYEERTCLQYIATKIKHYSGSDYIEVVEFGDSSALALHENIGGSDYITYIYLYDGEVKELFCEKDTELHPEAGFSIMEMQEFCIELAGDNLIYFSCSSGEAMTELYMGIYGEEEAF